MMTDISITANDSLQYFLSTTTYSFIFNITSDNIQKIGIQVCMSLGKVGERYIFWSRRLVTTGGRGISNELFFSYCLVNKLKK